MLELGLRHDFVDVIDEFDKACGLAVPRVLEPNIKVRTNAGRISAQHHDAIGEHHGLFNVVSHDENGAGRHLLVQPELKQFTAQVFGGQNVESRKRFVHEQHFRLDHQSTGKAYALLHAAGKLFGVRRFEAVQTDRIEGAQGSLASLNGGHSLRFQRSFDVLQNGEPGKEREALKDNGHVRHLAIERFAVPQERS